MFSTFEAENRNLDKHTEPQLKKRCAYKKKMCMYESYVQQNNNRSLFNINWQITYFALNGSIVSGQWLYTSTLWQW